MNSLRVGWQMVKSSWQVLKLDKELALLPLLSFAYTVGVVAVLVLAGLGLANAGMFEGITVSEDDPLAQVIGGAGLLLFYFIVTLIGNFFAGALIFGAVERFKGGDPTVRGSIAGARRRLGPLAGFSLLMATVGLILQIIEERVPFAGRIAVWLLDAAWNIANVFAVPVIVLSERSIRPLEATKESVAIIRKVWGESVVANLGIGLIGILTSTAYLLASMSLVIGSVATQAPSVLSFALAALLGLGFVAILLIFSALGAIAKAALYLYATTGAAPETFSKELLQASITQKKARKQLA